MRWLILPRRRTGRERGAVAVMVALIVSGVLLSLGALVTDVGSWYAERAQLQNGADAAAMAVAQTCARGACDTSRLATGTAGRYANLNANDGLTSVDLICGNGPGLFPCLTNACPLGTGNYVTVRTITLESGGSHLLPPMFGDLLLGETYDGRTISACATASWGSAGGGFGLGMTISLCAWKHATVSGLLEKFGPTPPYPIWPPPLLLGYPYVPLLHEPPMPGLPAGEQVLLFHGSTTDCLGSPAGWQLPGGFGYLNSTSGSCAAEVSIANTYLEAPGESITAECAAELATARTNHTVVYMPVYDGISGTGAGGTYHLAGFAAFVVTGGYLNGVTGGFKVPSNITGLNYCKGEQRCIYGFFTQGLVPRGIFSAVGGLAGAYTSHLTA